MNSASSNRHFERDFTSKSNRRSQRCEEIIFINGYGHRSKDPTTDRAQDKDLQGSDSDLPNRTIFLSQAHHQQTKKQQQQQHL